MHRSMPRIGYFCSLVPEEIIMAAGLTPVRGRGTAKSTSGADAYLYHNLCPYIKNLMSTGLEGGLTHLDGLVFARSCDGMRRMFDAWRAYAGSMFTYMLEAPKNTDERAVAYYTGQLKDLAESLGRAFGNEITEDSLRESIRARGNLRLSMQYIYSLQQSIPAPVRGSELFEMGVNLLGGERPAAMKDVDQFYQRARNASARRSKSRKVRLLISGNVIDRPDLFEIIEAAGAEIPAADVCTGLRHFARNVDDNGDPYTDLARAYLGAPHCARTSSPAERVQEIEDLVSKYSIDGVLLTSLKFCDLHLYDAPGIMKKLTDEGISVLFLENDYTFANKSQIKTRVEAFIEVLAAGGSEPC